MKGRKKEELPELEHPGDPQPEACSPGSIEQELDMCESGSLRGDEVMRTQGKDVAEAGEGRQELDRIVERNYHVNMAEEDREGDENSGDEHSSGYQGGTSDEEPAA